MTTLTDHPTTFDSLAWTERLAELAAQHDVPGAALAVFADGDVHEVAAGVTNRRTGVAATADTLFQIGSVTKVWTTTLLLALADDGVVDLDAPVRRYVPEFALRDEQVAASLRVRLLLNHTSGLPGDFFPDTGRGDDCLERYLAVLADVELAHPPGAFFSYSNAAFVLAGLVIERVTGLTWDAALRSRVIEPLGLPLTMTLPEEALLHRAAAGHVGTGAEQRVAPVWVLPRNCGPAGLIVAQARDVVAFGRLHLDGGVAQDGTRILSAESVAAMQVPTVDVPGATQGRIGFGLGWGLAKWSGTAVLQHDGGTIGQAAALRVLPERRVVVALLTNGGTWSGFRDAVFSELFPAIAGVTPPPLPVPTDDAVTCDAGEYVGTYRNLGAEIVVEVDGARLVVKHRALDTLEALAGGESAEFELVPQGGDLFLAQLPATPGWNPVVFLRDEAGRVGYVHVSGRAARRVG